MRPFVRALLLIAGCAALVATSRPRPGRTSIHIEAGKAAVFALHLKLSKPSPVPPAVSVHVSPYLNEPEVKSQLVGFLAPAVPSPQTLKALALLALNDHVLKGAGLLPGWLTGKLSDFTGLYFAPLLLAELWMLARPRPEPFVLVRRVAWAALGLGLLFTGIKTSPDFSQRYETALSLLGRRAYNTVDPTDLAALPMLAVAVWDARRLARGSAAKRAPTG